MTVVGAAIKGLRDTLAARKMLVGLWLLSLLFALPFGVVVGRALHRSIGATAVEQELRRGFDTAWYGEYAHENPGLAGTLRPTVIGATPFYDNLEDWLDGNLFVEYPEVVVAGVAYGLLWIFLSGGVIDRFARPAEAAVRSRFAQAGGLYFFRFLRLALLSGVLYFAIYRLHGFLFDRLEQWTRDVTREWTVLSWSLLFYLFTALLLTVVHMCFGYAKIATVVENRGGMLRTALRAGRFVFAFPLKTFALYYGLVAVSVLALAVYSLIAPGPGQSNAFTVLFAFVVGQVFLVVKLVLRLTLYGAQTSLYKSLASR